MTEIKGIGPARQRWFNASLGVFTFRDLAALSADEIESRLRADKQIASRRTIELWITEALNRAATAKPSAHQTAAPENADAEQQVNDTIEENASPTQPVNSEDDDGKGRPATRNNGWKPFASFVIEFQERPNENNAVEYRTSVHHMEADSSKEWPGIERDKHCQWMLDQIGDRISNEPVIEEPSAQEGLVEPVPVARSPVRVEIAQVRAYQPPQADNPVVTGQAGQSFEGYLKGNQPFALEIRFNLVGEASADLTAQQAVYRVRSYVQDQFTGESTQLGEAEPSRLVKGELSYAAKLREVVLQPGKYRLFAFVNLQAASVRPDFVTFPEVNVMR